jgi:hypothetical protein
LLDRGKQLLEGELLSVKENLEETGFPAGERLELGED